MATIELTSEDESRVEEFAGNLFMACLGAMELANVELGVRLGLYETLAGAGAMSAGEVAAATGIAERYAREWLEQQTVAGVLRSTTWPSPRASAGSGCPTRTPTSSSTTTVRRA